MSYQRWFSFSKRGLAPGRKPFLSCLLSLIFLLSTTPPSFAAGGWAATYGGAGNDSAHCIQQTSDGGYIVAGKTNSFGAGKADIWVFKLRSDGTVEWQKTYGGDDLDGAVSILQSRGGGYIVAGYTRSFGAGGADIWVLKLRADGTVEWQKTYGGGRFDEARCIQQTSDGGYIVAGETSSFGARATDVWILRLGPDGTVEWQKTYGGGSFDEARCIQETSDGGYIVAGSTSSFGAGDGDFWVLKLRPDGDVEWQKSYGGGVWDKADSVQQTRDGGYIVAGYSGSFIAIGTGTDLWVLKLRADGTIEWQKTYGGILLLGNTEYSIQKTSDEGYVVAGVTDSFGVEWGDAWVLKLRPDGSVEWQKTYGGYSYESAHSIQPTSDGGYIVAGYTGSFVDIGAGTDLLVMKLKPNGSINHPCKFTIYDTNTSEVESNATVLDTHATVRNSDASPKDSAATIQPTNVSAKMLCP